MKKLIVTELMSFLKSFQGVPIKVQCFKLGNFTVCRKKEMEMKKMKEVDEYSNSTWTNTFRSKGIKVPFWTFRKKLLYLPFLENDFN